MEINIPLLITYCRERKHPITVNISIIGPAASLIVIAGENREGSLRVFLDFTDINEVLIINNIIGRVTGASCLVQTEMDLARANPRQSEQRIANIEKLIYGTLADYITQMLLASHGKSYFPDLRSLPKHQMYFPDIEA